MTLHQAYPLMITSILLAIHSMFKVCQFRVKSEVQTLRIESGVDFKCKSLSATQASVIAKVERLLETNTCTSFDCAIL